MNSCKVCGIAIQNHRQFCTVKCRAISRQRRVNLQCNICGSNFEVYVAKLKYNAKYCSRKCSDIGRRKRNILICEQCNDNYIVARNRKDISRFCSKQCQARFLSRNTGREETSIEKKVRLMLCELGLEYNQEHKIYRYYCDFYVSKYNLVVECDGEYWHSKPNQIQSDLKKDKVLESLGYTVLRLSESEINNNELLCKNRITEYVQKSICSPS